MATRTPHTGVAGEVLTAANLAKYPKGWIGDAQVDSTQSGIGSTPTDITDLTVTVTVGADRKLKISGRSQISSASAIYGALIIVEDGVAIGRIGRVLLDAGEQITVSGFAISTPSAGTHTYKVQGETSSSTMSNGASATYPAILLVEDIGPDS